MFSTGTNSGRDIHPNVHLLLFRGFTIQELPMLILNIILYFQINYHHEMIFRIELALGMVNLTGSFSSLDSAFNPSYFILSSGDFEHLDKVTPFAPLFK